mmetsp:Transcript_46142/g.114786  ORF Transcript_46142/g.114786 Transcript_46142/m.114786 type:complete len:119 (-) Transcript_46142:5712-6068(-)
MNSILLLCASLCAFPLTARRPSAIKRFHYVAHQAATVGPAADSCSNKFPFRRSALPAAGTDHAETMRQSRQPTQTIESMAEVGCILVSILLMLLVASQAAALLRHWQGHGKTHPSWPH